MALGGWLDSWRGLGPVIVGMHAQGYDIGLQQYPDGWRANSSFTGIAHSVGHGSAWEPTPLARGAGRGVGGADEAADQRGRCRRHGRFAALMADAHEIIRWRRRHEGHRVVGHELATGGTVKLPGLGPAGVTIPKRIKRGLRCEQCGEVLWLDEARPDDPFR